MLSRACLTTDQRYFPLKALFSASSTNTTVSEVCAFLSICVDRRRLTKQHTKAHLKAPFRITTFLYLELFLCSHSLCPPLYFSHFLFILLVDFTQNHLSLCNLLSLSPSCYFSVLISPHPLFFCFLFFFLLCLIFCSLCCKLSFPLPLLIFLYSPSCSSISPSLFLLLHNHLLSHSNIFLPLFKPLCFCLGNFCNLPPPAFPSQ